MTTTRFLLRSDTASAQELRLQSETMKKENGRPGHLGLEVGLPVQVGRLDIDVALLVGGGQEHLAMALTDSQFEGDVKK